MRQVAGLRLAAPNQRSRCGLLSATAKAMLDRDLAFSGLLEPLRLSKQVV